MNHDFPNFPQKMHGAFDLKTLPDAMLPEEEGRTSERKPVMESLPSYVLSGAADTENRC